MGARAVPEGYSTATPYLLVSGASDAIEFYKKAFGATEVMRFAAPNGKIAHAEIQIGNSRIMLADEHPEMGDYVAMLENRILMAVDKYQAAVARGQKTHGEAMDVVKRLLSPKYGSDAMMNRVLKVLDAIGEGETLFEEAA